MRNVLVLPLLVGGTLACIPAGAASHLPPAVVDELRHATTMEILALDPIPVDRRAATDPPVAPSDVFHGFPVLGRSAVGDPMERERLVDLIVRGVEASDGKVAACFDPRHGVRVEREGARLELVICYECLQIEIHGSAAGPGGFAEVLTAVTVEPEVTRLYARHGLSIAR